MAELGDADAASATSSQTGALKTFGYGRPVLVQLCADGHERNIVLHTAKANTFGHDYRADRAAELILAYDTFNQLPGQAPALDVGVVGQNGCLHSVAAGGEFYLTTEYVDGTPYAVDLQRLRDTGELTTLDLQRTRKLAAYLAQIHKHKRHEPALYLRHIRDTIGNGEGIFGLTDSYPLDYALAGPGWLEQIEKQCVAWRWRLKRQGQRLSQIHGDFHPFNVLFGETDDFHLLDRSRSPWGEPADDVSCMTINYLFFSLQRSETMAPPFTQLWRTFWEVYLRESGDNHILQVMAPFFAWRGLVLASPVWYNVTDRTRQTLFRFIEHALERTEFDPKSIENWEV
ncbi:MAG: phosphotransferase [Caldilineaceae bacterium]